MPRRDEYDDEDDRFDDRDDDRPRARRGRDEDEDDYDDHDYEDRPRRRRGGRAAARERVSLPAIFLMILGGIGFGLAILNAVVVLTGVGGPNPFVPQNQAAQKDAGFVAGQVCALVATLTWGLIVFLGGLQMKNLRNRGFVVFSAIWAMLPCNWCFILGIPFGIWALVVLNDETVKRAF